MHLSLPFDSLPTPKISKFEVILCESFTHFNILLSSECNRIFRPSTKYHLIGVPRHKGRYGVEFIVVN